MSPTATRVEIPRVKACEGAERIHDAMLNAGGVVIEGFLTPEQVKQLNSDLDKPFSELYMGSKSANKAIQDFHGLQTKRLTNLVTHSRVFREEILDMDLTYDICDRAFADDNGAYWMAAAQAIEINPGNKAQKLHRDQSQYKVFQILGPDGPEAALNFLIAVTDFTEENGATRVIPGSHKWADFAELGSQDDTVPAVMKAGDALLITGKVVHGGGSNGTASEKRRGVGFAFTPSYLTPEEAYPFQISMETAKTMSKRAQRSIMFRSVYPPNSGGLWQCDYSELADFTGLDK